MEYADDGDLYAKCNDYRKKQQYFGEGDIWKVFIQIVKGLQSLHFLNIMH